MFFEKSWLYFRCWWAAPIVAFLRYNALPIGNVPTGGLLVIAPHPDDEAIGCGGLIALKRASGETVKVVLLTSGENSLPQHPRVTPEQLARQRDGEVSESVWELGVARDDLILLHAPDGGLSTLDDTKRAKLVSVLARLIREIRPSVIATPFCCDVHPDHQSANTLTWEAIKQAGLALQVWEYPLWVLWMLRWSETRQPEFQQFEKLDIDQFLSVKTRAIACHRTQVAPVAPWRRPTLSARFLHRVVNRYELFRRADFKPE